MQKKELGLVPKKGVCLLPSPSRQAILLEGAQQPQELQFNDNVIRRIHAGRARAELEAMIEGKRFLGGATKKPALLVKRRVRRSGYSFEGIDEKPHVLGFVDFEVQVIDLPLHAVYFFRDPNVRLPGQEEIWMPHQELVERTSDPLPRGRAI